MSVQSRGMTLLTTCAAALLAAATVFAQQKITPSSPASQEPPVWQRVVQMPDGRTFVTDGGMAIDVAVAKPPRLPDATQPGAVFARLLTRPYTAEIGLSDLAAGPRTNTFATPSGVLVNGNYVRFLRGVLPARARLRVNGEMDPIVIMLDGNAIAVVMPVRR